MYMYAMYVCMCVFVEIDIEKVCHFILVEILISLLIRFSL